MGLIDGINKIFDHRVRLGIMSILLVNTHADFTTLKEMLDVTDGNLASHLKALEQAGFIQVEKRFINRRPNTRYEASASGTAAFRKHLDALENILGKASGNTQK